MTQLTYREVLHLLDCVRSAHGISSGYSTNPDIGKIQAKLSMMLEMRARLGDSSTEEMIPMPPTNGDLAWRESVDRQLQKILQHLARQ